MGEAMECLQVKSSMAFALGQEADLEWRQTIATPHTNTIKGNHRDGRRHLRARLLGTYQTNVRCLLVGGEAPHL
jgi:hypothetical protein